MRIMFVLALLGVLPVRAGQMPEKAADYHAALMKRPESAALFDRFRDAWLEERSVEDLEKELLSRAEAKEPGAWATLGRAWLAAGKTEQALGAFGKARQQTPSAWLDLEAAKLRMAAKDFAAAEKDALSVPEADSQRPEALKLAGLACLRAERIDAALAHWTKAVAMSPGDTGLLEDLTELTRREGRIELALDFCGKWRDATTDAYGKAMATLRRSELLLGSQRFDEAMTELVAVLEVSADDSWLERESLARAEQAHRQRGDSTGWEKWIGMQAQAHPARLNFLRTSALAQAAVGKPEEALGSLTEVMKRSPGDMAVRWQRIALLEQSLKLTQAYDECVELAAREKTEAAGLRLAELAFRLEKKDELKRALDGVIAAAEPAKRVGLAGLYSRYGLPEESERIWREEAGGEFGGLALRQLAKHLKTIGRDQDSIEIWKQLGALDRAQDRMEAAQMLGLVGQREAARKILLDGREKFSAEPGYEAALADLEMADGKPDPAREIYLKLARAAKQPDDLTAAVKGWLRTTATISDPVKDLGDETADRCLRAAWLASAGKPLPEVRDGDELERAVRQGLLRGLGRWTEVLAMMEARSGGRGPLFLSELAEVKSAAGDLKGAIAVAQEWRGRVPDQIGPWLFEAGVLEKLGRMAEAMTLLRRAAARFEDNEEVARRLFGLLQQSLDPREALDWAWKRHDRAQDESIRSGWLREILQVSKEREKLDELQARFEERARRDPASPAPLMALAELARARGDLQAELDLLRRAAVNAPRNVEVVTSLAKLEERSGEAVRALERYTTLVRLNPGPDTTRQLAQAKIRLGDIEGGIRDLQTLAGQSGLDLKAMEMSVGDLTSRGYVEEAIRMLAAIDPAQRTARLEFIRGILLDADGREREAVECFLRVLAEPEDPAEAGLREMYSGGQSRNMRRYSRVIQVAEDRENRYPGAFGGYQVPQSLVEAQEIVKSRLCLLAMDRGGEFWQAASKAVPDLSVATLDQWREAFDYSKASGRTSRVSWWDFFRLHPSNPLGPVLIVDFGQTSEGKPDEIEAVLKSKPPFSVQLQLRWGRGEWRADQPGFLESARPEDWRDERVQELALAMATHMSMQAIQESAKPMIPAADCARVMAVLEKVEFKGLLRIQMELLRSRMALMVGDVDGFLRHLMAWSEMDRMNSAEAVLRGYRAMPPVDAFAAWRKSAGDAPAEAVLAKIPSPMLRCLLANDPKPAARLSRIKRELAALPPSAPLETRRGLILLSWQSLAERNSDDDDPFRPSKANPELVKQLEAAAADESDPRLMLEALTQLMHHRSRDSDISQEYLLKLKQVATRLAASTDPADQVFAARLLGNSAVRHGGNPPLTSSRWGAAAGFSGGSPGRGLLRLPVILAMEDRQQAEREAAKSLEDSARASAGRPEYLREPIQSLAKAELLDAALSRISIPPDAGLGRRVALLTLLEAADRKDRSRALLAEIAAVRPWETNWTVKLALITPDDVEMRRLLDLVSEREDFDRILGQLLVPQNRVNADEFIAQLNRLADWAPQAKGASGWIDTALMMLVGGQGGLPPLTAKSGAQLDCCRRYVKLALAGKRTGEFGFRVMTMLRYLEPADAVNEAAWQALLSGAYTSREPALSSQPVSKDMQLAALEHLVLLATAKGDEVAFPAEFRERLKAVDPDLDAWICKLLAAKAVAELPEVANATARSTGWVALARHEAAMLRAINLPGRDSWLLGVFKANQQDTLSQNILHVIRESLLEAVKSKALSARVFGLLEASAGPRKDWGKKVTANEESRARPGRLQRAADSILSAASQSNPATLLAVLDLLRDARVPVRNSDTAFTNLGNALNQQAQSPGKDGLLELLASRRDIPYTLGTWQWRGYGAKPIFQWELPELLQRARSPDIRELLNRVAADPDAGFVDLLLASIHSNDNNLRRRALVKAAPDLVALPVEIRNAVIDHLTSNTFPETGNGLPEVVSARIRENRAAERKERMVRTREALQNLKTTRPGSSSDQSLQYGSLMGQVIGDDEALANEILAGWRPIRENDKNGKQTEAFVYGMISNARGDLEASLALLRQLDGLWKDSFPDPKNPHSAASLNSFGGRLRPEDKVNPLLWQQIARLSPGVQARVWLSLIRQYRDPDTLRIETNRIASLREAAKDGEVTRAALEWLIDSGEMQDDGKARIDCTHLILFLKAMRNAGFSSDLIYPLISQSYALLPRMSNPALLMAETPGLLEGLGRLSAEEVIPVIQGIVGLAVRAQQEQRARGGRIPETDLLAPVHPLETTAVLKFILGGGTDLSRGYVDQRSTAVVIALDDSDLLTLWIRAAGKSISGDLALVVALLEKDRVGEVVAMAPAAGQELRSSNRIYFDKHLESLIVKLRKDSSTPAFRLTVRLSMQPDARGEQAPTEKWEDRKARLIGEFGRLSDSLPLADSADLILMLQLNQQIGKPVPQLDAFASDQAAREFKSMLTNGSSTPLGRLFIPAICSRVHAGDLSGIDRLSVMLTSLPVARRNEALIHQQVIYPVHSCLIIHLDSLKAQPPEALRKSLLDYAKAIAVSRQGEARRLATQLVYLISPDAASLDVSLKSCGLERVTQSQAPRNPYNGVPEPATMKAYLRLSLLHPFASEILVGGIDPSHGYGKSAEIFFPLLSDAALRGRISPAFFLKWSRGVFAPTAEQLEALKLYANERQAEFDDNQRIDLDRALERWSRDQSPERQDEMRRRREEMDLREAQDRIRRMNGE